MRTGFGYDSHRFASGRKLILGGVEVPHEFGLKGHSDADVLAHAVTDAILGAAGLGDIGKHFPDNDPAYKDADSLKLLTEVVAKANTEGFEVSWVDATIVCEKPKLAPFIEKICESLRSTGITGVNVKAKTNEGMGFIGRGEGMAAFAVATLIKKNLG